MELMHRLGNTPSEKYYDEYLQTIKNNPGCCDTVWLASLYGYPKLEDHRKWAKRLEPLVEKFRKNGLNVSVQISNTLGHGKYMSARDCSGLVYEGSPAENMVGPEGEVAEYCFCWNGKNFKEYLLETVRIYAALKPDCVWVDDDFRPGNHNPVCFGCFCDDCIKAFNERHQANFTRAELIQEILHGELVWRERWITFTREGMGSLMREMGEALHALSPESELGYQYYCNGSYTGYGYSFIFDAMKVTTGKAPLSRPGGGAYFDYDVNVFLEKALAVSWQNKMLPPYVTRKCPEVESLPNIALGKTPAATAFETSLYFAFGNTDMTYAIMGTFNDVPSHYDQLLRSFSQNRTYWDKLSARNFGTHQAGLQYFMSEETWKRKLNAGEGFIFLNRENWLGAKDLIRDAIPVAFDCDDRAPILLYPDTAKVLSEKELQMLLTKNVITDAETLEILADRVDLGLSVRKEEESFWLHTREKFLPHPILPQGLESWNNSIFFPGKGECYLMKKTNEAVEPLAVYYDSRTGIPYDESFSDCIAEAVVETGKGGKWAILAYAPWRGIVSTLKRDMLLNIAEYISDNGLCARLYTNTPFVLLPRKDENGKTVCVSFANYSMGKSEETTLMIRNPKTARFKYIGQYGTEQELSAEKKDGAYYIKLPTQDAFTVATVFCDEITF